MKEGLQRLYPEAESSEQEKRLIEIYLDGEHEYKAPLDPADAQLAPTVKINASDVIARLSEKAPLNPPDQPPAH